MHINRAIMARPFQLIVAAVLTAATGSGARAAVRQVPQQYPTIQAAVNAAVNFDMVNIAPGTYTGPGNRDINLVGKRLTIQGAGPDATIIDIKAGQQDQHTGFMISGAATSGTVIQNLTIMRGLSFNGAAMILANSSPTIRNVTFRDNHANCWGAAVYFDSGASPKFHDCRFLDNYSTDDGGAIFGFNGDAEFHECLFARNEAPTAGGAILIWTGGNGLPKIVNSTIVNNASNWGAAIYSDNIEISNSIITGNAGTEIIYDPQSAGTVTIKHSIVQGGFGGQGNIDAVPVFVDAEADDFHLASGSAGIDAGDPATVVPLGTLDLDGDPRAFGTAIDMGIDEFRKSGDATGDHLVDVNDLMLVIGTWGPCSWSNADLDGNFSVNVDDLLMVVNGWGN